MAATVGDGSGGRLEGLCEQAGGAARAGRGAIRPGLGCEGIERLEAHLKGRAYSPHRHDTYAIGITLAGAQRFGYRGAGRVCLPGQGHVLHPDETHDGAAGTEAGFCYRILYVDPALVQEALGGRPLPFVADPILGHGSALEALRPILADLDEPIDEVAKAEIVIGIADMLEAASGVRARRQGPLALAALRRARDRIVQEPRERPAASELEALTGLDRWTLARQFRAAFGTSPTRFRTMRQLDRARRLMRQGLPPAEAALEAGFADQSHLTRMFKRSYGLTPGAWRAALATAGPPPHSSGDNRPWRPA